LTTIPKPERAAAALVAAGLWVVTDDTPEGPGPGWRVHDYDAYQLSRDEVERRREQRRVAGRTGGQRSGEARSKRAASPDEAATKRAASPGASTADEANRNPDPPPDPDPGVVETKEPSPQPPPRGRAAGAHLVTRQNPHFVNRGPIGLFAWQFEKFVLALAPEHGDEAPAFARRWVAGIDERAWANEWPTTGKESTWWQARFDEAFSRPTSTTKTAGNAAALRAFAARA
jgi:hypothetical protein